MNRVKGKNILCIYYHFPPIKGIGTLRNAKFYTSIKKDARKVYVMTTANQSFLPSDNYDITLENIIPLATMDFRTIHHKVFGSKGSMLPNKKTTSLRDRLVDFIHVTPLQTILGEGGRRFIRDGIRQGRKLIKEEGIDMIFSSFRPSATHLIARALKKEFPHITWIADYRDITPDPMRSQEWTHGLITAAHKRILKYADEVITVSDGLKANLLKYHNKVSVIRNGYEEELLNRKEVKRSKFFTLAYTGIIYRQTQRAELLFAALKELIDEGEMDMRNIQLVHAGKDPEYWREIAAEHQLSAIFVNKGIVPREEAVKIQQSANINILLTWSSKELQGIVTGKIYEYLAARRPILTIINGIPDPEIEKIIEESASGKVFYHKEEELKEIKSYILTEYRKWKYNNLSMNEGDMILSYSWEHQFRQWNIPLSVIHSLSYASK